MVGHSVRHHAAVTSYVEVDHRHILAETNEWMFTLASLFYNVVQCFTLSNTVIETGTGSDALEELCERHLPSRHFEPSASVSADQPLASPRAKGWPLWYDVGDDDRHAR
jgi:hypothetical protein